MDRIIDYLLCRRHSEVNPLIKQLVNQKLNRMTPGELERLGRKYGLNISARESVLVMEIIQSRSFDIFQNEDRRALLKEITKNTNPTLAKNIEALFRRFLRWAEKQGY